MRTSSSYKSFHTSEIMEVLEKSKRAERARLFVLKGKTEIEKDEAQLLASGGPCSSFTKSGFPCPLHGDRLLDGKWLCHIHDPDGKHAHNLAYSDVEGQMIFSDLSNGTELFTKPDDEQAKAIVRRIRIFRKWEEEQNV